jgi:hypothetical protein
MAAYTTCTYIFNTIESTSMGSASELVGEYVDSKAEVMVSQTTSRSANHVGIFTIDKE